MTLDDWILALHVLSAFTLIAALVLFWVLYWSVTVRADPGSAALMTLGRLGAIAVGIGMGGTLVFGVWLAISLDEYQLWDGWVIAGLVLWAIAGATGQRAGALAQQDGKMRESMIFHAVTSVVALLIIIDMIWKPGA